MPSTSVDDLDFWLGKRLRELNSDEEIHRHSDDDRIRGRVFFYRASLDALCSVSLDLPNLFIDGRPLASNMRVAAEGSGIYGARNAICAANPGATVRIDDVRTGKELQSESPCRCPAFRGAERK